MYNVWENVLAEIEQKISAGNFSTWFQDTSLISTEDGHIIIGVKNSFFIKQLRSKFLDIIKDALINNGVEVKDIDFEIQTKSKSKVRPREVTVSSTQLKDRLSSIKMPKNTKSFSLAPTRGEWKHRQITAVAPEGAVWGEMVIRLIKVPASEHIIIDNFRWAGVPFYIRTGKRMAAKSTKIVVQFKDIPMILYGPFEAPVYKVQNTCRMRLVMKCKLNKRTREFLSELMVEFGKSAPRDSVRKTVRLKSNSRINISVDLNPTTV